MKKRLIFTGLLALLFAACCFAQKPYKVVFYNLENFFDTINDPEVNDDEFTPEGPKKWNSVKYAKKLGNTEKVLFDIAGIDKDYPIVIGVSEVENRSVLEDIIATPKMAPGNYRISHYDSPEARGVDVAFMYRPDVFKLEGSAPIRTQIPSLPNFKTRDISTMWGTIDGEPFFFMVAHWPSRLGGKDASEFKRIAVGEQMRRIADSIPRPRSWRWATSTTIRPIRACSKDWVPSPRRRSFSRVISSVRSTPCCVPVWERWLTATPGISSTIS